VTLAPKKQSHTHRGVIEHSDIIGKQSRQVVRSTKGSHYRIHEPTLAEYVRLTPRLVTPVRSRLLLSGITPEEQTLTMARYTHQTQT
jgi:tRNA A58 N-methylase Trm61